MTTPRKKKFQVDVNYTIEATSHDQAFQCAKDFTINSGTSISSPTYSWQANRGLIISIHADENK